MSGSKQLRTICHRGHPLSNKPLTEHDLCPVCVNLEVSFLNSTILNERAEKELERERAEEWKKSCHSAIDERDALRAENATLRSALQRVRDGYG